MAENKSNGFFDNMKQRLGMPKKSQKDTKKAADVRERKKNAEFNFYALTPIDNVEISIYKSAMDFVFAHNNVRNVAVSGSYGSGKSSILASYEKKHSKKKFLHISLAHFTATENNKTNTDSKEKTSKENSEQFCPKLGNDSSTNFKEHISTESMLEGKILNQLLHQISPGRIPRTNFRVTKETKIWRTLGILFFMMLGIVLGLYSFLFKQWVVFLQSLTLDWLKDFLSFSSLIEIRLAASVIFLLVFLFFTYLLIKLQENRHFIKKASVKGLEIEIFEECNDSYFDKYLNEVLYLFSKAKADVIVFEDIDRYESGIIFERLHEINTLVNNSRKGKPLRFFYLMRDDIFSNKDRTKFFDFIIPIVPVVDGSNSLDKFIECFEKSGLIGNDVPILDFEFLQGLSLYIDDMRILHNIHNEFLVYHNRLTTTEQDPNKMLGLITFKNLFPRDFADLQFGRGFMFEIIGGHGKEQLIASEQSRLQETIKSKTEKTRQS